MANVVIGPADAPTVVIQTDGNVRLRPGVSIDQASMAFWAAVQELAKLHAAQQKYRLNGSNSVAVGNERFIKDFKECPRGVKVQLLGPGGVAVYGVYNGDTQWKGWYPVPGSPVQT